MSAGSYIRFGVGFLLSLVVLTSFLFGGSVGILGALLAFLFIALSILWVLFRF